MSASTTSSSSMSASVSASSVLPSFTNPAVTALNPTATTATTPTMAAKPATHAAAGAAAAANTSWDYNTLEDWLSVHDSLVVPSDHGATHDLLEHKHFEVAELLPPQPVVPSAGKTPKTPPTSSSSSSAVVPSPEDLAISGSGSIKGFFLITFRDDEKKVVLSQKYTLEKLGLIHHHLLAASNRDAASSTPVVVPKIPLPYTTIAFFFSSQKPFSALGPEIVIYLQSMLQYFGASFLFALFDSDEVFSLVQPVPQHTQELMEESLKAKEAEMAQLGPEEVAKEAELWAAWEVTEAELHSFRRGWLQYKRQARLKEFENANDNLDFVENNEELLQAKAIQAHAKGAWEKAAEELRDYSQDRAESLLKMAEGKIEKWQKSQVDKQYVLKGGFPLVHQS